MKRKSSLVDIHGNNFRVEATSHYSANTDAPELKDWHPGLGSADSDQFGENETLRARNRDVVRNDGLASGHLQTLTDNVVGKGLKLTPKPHFKALGKNEDWAEKFSEKAQAEFSLYCESLMFNINEGSNFSQDSRLVFSSSFENGGAVALPLWKKRATKYNTCFQLVEIDRLCNPNYAMDTETLRDGVEINSYGTPIAHHIKKSHPGDIFTAYSDDWIRIPTKTTWGRKRVLHIFNKKRIGQSKGVPGFSTVLSDLKVSKHYSKVELQAAISNGLIAAFVESDLDNDLLRQIFTHDEDALDRWEDARQNWQAKLQGGSIYTIPVGNKINTMTPARPASSFADFMECIARHMSAGLNVPYELLLKDFSKTNYSSARAALLEAWRYFNVMRAWLITYWAKPVYELWLEEAVSKGILDAPNFWQNKEAYSRCYFTGPGRGWIDPVKEAKAVGIKIDANVSTLEFECAEQGHDWEDVLEQGHKEKKKQLFYYKKELDYGNEIGLTPDQMNAVFNKPLAESNDNAERTIDKSVAH